jgi:vacuolar-type H+-ATPase subunit H
MSTPKEKAEELVEKFYQYANEEFKDKSNEYPGQVLSERRKIRKESSKQCSLISINELLEAIQYLEPNIVLVSLLEYWLEVKEEIENL